MLNIANPSNSVTNSREYQKFFQEKLKAYGVKSPAELTKEQKDKFFSEIKTEWKNIAGACPVCGNSYNECECD